MVDAEQLKETLKAVEQNDFELEEGQRLGVLQVCVEHIGSSDPELRDDLIYATLARWIVDKKYFDAATLNRTLNLCLDEQHLTFGLGEQGDGTVFTRSFSSLVIACLLERHRDTPFLSAQKISDVKSQMLEYLLKEQDYRGLTEHGWAHAVAHAADVLDELARCKETTREDLSDILDTVSTLASNPLSVFTCDEEERLAYAVRTIFENDKMTKDALVSWLEKLATLARHCPDHGAAEGYRSFVNLKHFLRALYFELEHRSKAEEKTEFSNRVDETLQVCYRLQTGQEGA